MARNRIITQSEALFVSPSPATGYMFSSGTSGVNYLNQLQRIQSANYSASISRTPVNQFGQLAAIDRIILEPPTVNLDLSYIVADTSNADYLGFSVDGTSSAISGILNKTEDEKNYFIEIVREGADAVSNADASSTKSVIAIGNGFISNFTASASVGQFPTESVTIEGLNMVSYIGATGLASPAIVPESGTRVSGPTFTIPTAVSGVNNAVPAIRPGDITVTFSDPVFGPKVSDLKIQSYNISVPLSREPLNKLGSTFPFSREITFPVDITCSIEANLGDLVTGDLSSVICNDAKQDITIDLRKPVCGSTNGPIAVKYRFLGGKLDTQQYSSSIGASNTVSLQFTAQIGGPEDLNNGLIISGVAYGV